jgi:hypothetical protein
MSFKHENNHFGLTHRYDDSKTDHMVGNPNRFYCHTAVSDFNGVQFWKNSSAKLKKTNKYAQEIIPLCHVCKDRKSYEVCEVHFHVEKPIRDFVTGEIYSLKDVNRIIKNTRAKSSLESKVAGRLDIFFENSRVNFRGLICKLIWNIFPSILQRVPVLLV